jgi:hypothetical protein
VVGVAFGSDHPRWIFIRESAVIAEHRPLLLAMEFPTIRGSGGLNTRPSWRKSWSTRYNERQWP